MDTTGGRGFKACSASNSANCIRLSASTPSADIELLDPSDDSRSTLATDQQGLEAIYRRGYRFMKGGVMLLDLVDANREQLSLFDTPEREAQ